MSKGKKATGQPSEVSFGVVYLNNRIEITSKPEETMEELLQKIAEMFQVSSEESGFSLVTEETTIVESKEDLQSNTLYYFMFVKDHDEEMQDDSIKDESEELSDEDGSLMSLGAKRRHMEEDNYDLPGSLKVKRSKGQKREFFCPYYHCRKAFSETGNLKTHIRTHTGERPFACSYKGCDKKFITKGHLKSHELIHSGDKPYVCDFHGCTKRYSRSGRLKIHKRTHTGERPFRCKIPGCNKAFTEKGNLKTHMRIHSGERPYKCTYEGCDKTFTTQGHLTDHQRRHSGDRPFKCENCGKAFMRSSTLKIHMRRHTGERPYPCPYPNCGKAFSESGNLKTHMKTHAKKSLSSNNLLEKRPCKTSNACEDLSVQPEMRLRVKTEQFCTPAMRHTTTQAQAYIQDGNDFARKEFLDISVKLMKESQKKEQIFKSEGGVINESLRLPLNELNQQMFFGEFKTEQTPSNIPIFTNGNGESSKYEGFYNLMPGMIAVGTPNAQSQMMSNSPLNIYTNFNFINVCSPLSNLASPFNFGSFQNGITQPLFAAGSSTKNASNEKLILQQLEEAANTKKDCGSNQAATTTTTSTDVAFPQMALGRSPTFSPFMNSPQFMQTFANNPSFSMLASIYDNAPGTPNIGTSRNSIFAGLTGTNSGVEDFGTLSTKTSGTTGKSQEGFSTGLFEPRPDGKGAFSVYSPTKRGSNVEETPVEENFSSRFKQVKKSTFAEDKPQAV